MKTRFFKSNRHSFWQALVVAGIIFWTGIMLGILFEESRVSKLEKFYKLSETEIFDIQLTQNLLTNKLDFDCSIAVEETINFADKIYEEAKTLEKYDNANKITEDIIEIHKKYDLLRTMLWVNAIELQEKCRTKINIITYLYEYTNPGTNTQAKQIAISKVTLDLKKKYGDKVILIPIAYDTGVKSLNFLRAEYKIDKFPVVIINQKDKITELATLKDLEIYLTI